MTRKLLITGRVVGSQSHNSLGSLTVEAWDKDLICDDLLGNAVTDGRGEFRIQFDESHFRELFFDREPDILFKVFRRGQPLEAESQVVGRNRVGFEVRILVREAKPGSGDGSSSEYFDPPQPQKLANLSELHYRAIKPPKISQPQHSRQSAARPSHSKRRRRPHYSMRPGLRWNRESARRVLGDRVSLSSRPSLHKRERFSKGRGLRSALPELKFSSPPRQLLDLKDWNGIFVCTPPNIGIEGWWPCNDNLAGTTINRVTPLWVFRSEADPKQAALDFLTTVRASMPMFLPYREASVQPAGAWLYQGGGFHGSMDYLKTDSQDIAANGPSFGVYAIAAGTVVTAEWNDFIGNYVIIEHQADNGDRYRSFYMHLRNGATNDLNQALAIDMSVVGSETARAEKYLKFAQKEDPGSPNATNWGTDDQTIQVGVGDSVYPGQFLGWSGNTGYGGAGNGLESDGTPSDPASANNHLHFELTVPDPTPGSTDWVLVDPYGVYEQVVSADGSTCYELGEDTAFVRLFAPFYPDFYNLPLDLLLRYWSYYTGMGMTLQTVSVHRWNDTLLASGSFQKGLSPDWFAYLYMTSEEFDYWYWHPDTQNYRVRQISVTTDSAGNARFSVIWMPWGTEGYFTYWDMTQEAWDAEWESLVINDSYRIEDHAVYEVQGTIYHAAVFIKDGDTNFQLWEHLSVDEFQQKFNDLYAEGFQLTSINTEELSTGRLYTGIWRITPGWWAANYDMTGDWFQNRYLELGGAGYRLHKIQGYDNSNLFAAIWVYG